MMHTVHIGDNYLQNIIDGKKKSEVLKLNEADFQVGDILKHSRDKWDPDKNILMRQTYYVQITHVHIGDGLKEGYVCLSIEPGVAK